MCVASCHIRVSFLSAPFSLPHFVALFLLARFNYHRKDIKRSFISLVRLWPELSTQSKQRKCGLKNGLALPAGVATRLLLSLFSFPFDPVGECWNLSCWWIVAHCAPLQLCRPIIMASLSALMETEKVLPQLRLPSSLIINLESFWHRRERVELPSPSHTKLQRVLQSKLCFNTPIK